MLSSSSCAISKTLVMHSLYIRLRIILRSRNTVSMHSLSQGCRQLGMRTQLEECRTSATTEGDLHEGFQVGERVGGLASVLVGIVITHRGRLGSESIVDFGDAT